MKHLYVIAIITATIAFVACFDAIIVFLLSGFIPGINITLAPSTSIAVMVASTVLIATIVLYRQAVYTRCLSLYDALFGFKKKKSTSGTGVKLKLPKRRYQEL